MDELQELLEGMGLDLGSENEKVGDEAVTFTSLLESMTGEEASSVTFEKLIEQQTDVDLDSILDSMLKEEEEKEEEKDFDDLAETVSDAEFADMLKDMLD